MSTATLRAAGHRAVIFRPRFVAAAFAGIFGRLQTLSVVRAVAQAYGNATVAAGPRWEALALPGGQALAVSFEAVIWAAALAAVVGIVHGLACADTVGVVTGAAVGAVVWALLKAAVR